MLEGINEGGDSIGHFIIRVPQNCNHDRNTRGGFLYDKNKKIGSGIAYGFYGNGNNCECQGKQ